MRAVGRFQIFAENDPEKFLKVIEIIQKWVAKKYRRDGDGWCIAKNCEPAAVREELCDIAGGQLYSLETAEFSGANEVKMLARLLGGATGLFLEVELRIGGQDEIVSESRPVVKSPAFFKDIIQSVGGWRYRKDGDSIFRKVFDVSEANIEDLVKLLESPDRRLPVVVISKSSGGEVVPGVSDRISYGLLGLAHVCRLDEEGAWALSDRFGRVWSCYNQAIRVYWPRLNFSGSV